MTALLVAGSGGHLQQLYRLADRIEGLDPSEAVWVTYETAQTKSLLADRDVLFVDYPAPRDVFVNVRNARIARRLVRERRFDVAVSTGASIAVAFLPVTARRGVASHFIESATRIDGPSLTGRLLRAAPGVRTWCQYRSWARPPWQFAGSVFDGFAVEPVEQATTAPTRFVVTLGSAATFGFRRLVHRLVQLLPSEADVLWQTGPTDVDDLPIHARFDVPGDELAEAIAAADVVISHAGIGSALVALEAGRMPVLVPRRAAHGEHIDDHQDQIGRELGARGLAVVREADELSWDDLVRAAAHRATSSQDAPPIVLR